MAVYTALDAEDVARLLAAFDAGRLERFSPIVEGIENTNYRVAAEGAEYVLTVYERAPAEQVEAVLQATETLAERGVPCPRARRTGAGGLVGRHRGRPVSLVAFTPGESALAPDGSRLESLGCALAGLHRRGADLSLPGRAHDPEVLLPAGRRLAACLAAERPELSELSTLLLEECGWQESRLPDPSLPGGLIHADLFRDNVLFAPGEARVTGLRDFHLAGRGPWLFDLAVVLLDWCWGRQGVDGNRARGLLRGYRATTHWSCHDLLALLGAEPIDQRVVIDRDRLTAAGVTSGIDGALALAVELFGRATAERIQHLLKIRDLQDRTGGFAAFIPWSFQSNHTKLSEPSQTGVDYLRMVALSRLVLDNIDHIQAGWVTEGPHLAQIALTFGADDFGGVLMEESVVKATGLSYEVTAPQVVSLIAETGMTPAQRNTKYEIVRTFENEPAPDRQQFVDRYFSDFLSRKMNTLLLPEVRNLSASCRVVVEDIPGKSWGLALEQGRLSRVSESNSDDQCTFVLASDVFCDIVAGKRTPHSAFYEKKIDIEGDIETGLKLATALAEFFENWPCEEASLA